MEKRKMTQVEITPEYEQKVRENQIRVHPSNSQVKKESIEQFHKKGTLSHEVFAKTNSEKKYLKFLKSRVDNERFAKIVANNVLKEK